MLEDLSFTLSSCVCGIDVSFCYFDFCVLLLNPRETLIIMIKKELTSQNRRTCAAANGQRREVYREKNFIINDFLSDTR